MKTFHNAWFAACAAALVASACNRSDESGYANAAEVRSDSARDTTATSATTAARDSGLTTRTQTQDADQDFLRQMVDHHQGIIELTSVASTQATGTVQKDAERIHSEEAKEQQDILQLLQKQYGDSVTPMMLSSERGQIDSFRTMSDSTLNRSFYQAVVAHHEEGVRLIDQMMPQLTHDNVKRMAKDMKSDMEKEIRQYRNKTTRG